MAHGQNVAREVTAHREGALAEEQVTRAATTALLQEAHEAHAWRYLTVSWTHAPASSGRHAKEPKGRLEGHTAQIKP